MGFTRSGIFAYLLKQEIINYFFIIYFLFLEKNAVCFPRNFEVSKFSVYCLARKKC